MEYLVVDTGLQADEVREQVRVGDLISFATLPLDLPDDLVSGHTWTTALRLPR